MNSGWHRQLGVILVKLITVRIGGLVDIKGSGEWVTIISEKRTSLSEFCQQVKGLSFLHLYNKNGWHWWFPPGKFLHRGLELQWSVCLGYWCLEVFVRILLAKYTLNRHMQGNLFIVFHSGIYFYGNRYSCWRSRKSNSQNQRTFPVRMEPEKVLKDIS